MKTLNRCVLVLLFCLSVTAWLNRETVYAQTNENISLPGGCIRHTPVGKQPPVCCISGFVIVDEQIVEGAEITIKSDQGQVTLQSAKFLDTELPPHYFVSLSDEPLAVKANDFISITARYSGIEQTIHYQVKSGGQQVNIVLPRPAPQALAFSSRIGWQQAELGNLLHPTAVDVDSMGNVYVLDGDNGRVQVFKDGIILRAWGTPGNIDGQFGTVTGIAVDSEDNVHIVDVGNRRVYKFTSDGSLLSTLISWKDAITGTTRTFSAPYGIAIDRYDNLYVTDAGAKRLFMFSSTYKFNKEWGDTADLKFNSLSGVAVVSGTTITDTILYVIDKIVPSAPPSALDSFGIKKFNFGGNPIIDEVWSQVRLDRPIGIIASEAYIYISDVQSLLSATVHLKKFTHTGILEDSWGSGRESNPCGGFYLPGGITIYGTIVYIADRANDRLQLLDNKSGQFVSPDWGDQKVPENQLRSPGGVSIVSVNGLDILFVADTLNNRIVQMKTDGSIINKWNGQGTKYGVFKGPTDIAVDPHGRLYVTERCNHRIRVFRIEQSTLIELDATDGSNLPGGPLNEPNGIAVGEYDGTIKIYATDAYSGGHRILEFHLQGEQLVFDHSVLTWKDQLAQEQAFSFPTGVALNQNYLYVADWGKNHIVRCNLSNGLITQCEDWIDSTSFVQLSRPFRLTIDQKTKDLYVTVSGNKSVLVFNQSGELVNSLSEPGMGPGQGNASGVVVDSKKNVFTTGRGIQKFSSMNITRPVANIVQLSSNATALSPSDILTITAQAQDSDESNEIKEYSWKFINTWTLYTKTFSTTSSLAVVSSTELPPGPYDLVLQVEDTEFELSAPVTVTNRIYVEPLSTLTPEPTTNIPTPTPDPGIPTPTPTELPPTCKTHWTILLYLVGDYDDNGALMLFYQKTLERLRMFKNPCVQIAVQIDGPNSIPAPLKIQADDTLRYVSMPSGGLVPANPAEQVPEQQMDDSEKLAAFVKWGQKSFPADHYYLAIADHAQALQGIGFDITTDVEADGKVNYDKRLTVSSIRDALKNASVAPIDILHLDGCSMNTIEVAYELQDVTKYLIVSQYLGWSFFAYDDYAKQIDADTKPEKLVKAIVERYAAYAEGYQLPYTITGLTMERIGPVVNGLNELVKRLKAWVALDTGITRRQKLISIRAESQHLDSNQDRINNPLDEYVDLLNWVQNIYSAAENKEIQNKEIQEYADLLRNELQPSEPDKPSRFILANRRGSYNLLTPSGDVKFIRLDKANGISIFYPCIQIDSNSGIPQNVRCTDENPPSLTASSANIASPFLYTHIYGDYIHNHLGIFTRASYWDEFLQIAVQKPVTDSNQLELVPAPASILESPQPLIATQTHSLAKDLDNNGLVSPGDLLLLQTLIINTGDGMLTNVVFLQQLGRHLEPVPSSMPLTSVYISSTATITIGNILPKTSHSIIYQVQLNSSIPVDVTHITIPATVSADNAPLPEPVVGISGHAPEIFIARQIFLPLIGR